MTGLALISNALKQLGVLAAGETLSSEDAAEGLSRLNDWIDALGTERLTIYYVARTTKTLTAATTSYTIGTGGAINMARPVSIESLGLVIDTTAITPVEIPIALYTDQDWQNNPIKSLTAAQPSGAYYDYGWTAGLGLMYPWPIPTVNTTQLVIYAPRALTEFADLVTDYTFPPGYRRFLRTNLALELAPEYGRPVDPVLVTQAIDSKADIKRANHRIVEMSMDAALLRQPSGIYSIYSDTNGGGR